jgi:site-specific DNA recombinase
MKLRAEQGYVTGGKCYGDTNQREGAFVKRVINPDEAAVVRRVFEMYAAGVGMLTIAHKLNEEHVRCPRGRVGKFLACPTYQTCKTSRDLEEHETPIDERCPACSKRMRIRRRGWAPSGIREVLRRGAYRGELQWGKLRKVTKKGSKRQEHRPESEWLTIQSPALRIIPEDLWQRVKSTLDEREALSPRSLDGKKLIGRPRFQDESAYLLTGFTECSVWGGRSGRRFAGTARLPPAASCRTMRVLTGSGAARPSAPTPSCRRKPSSTLRSCDP